MFEYEWEMTEQERIEMLRNNYRRYGLGIFESFEEYCRNALDDEN